MRIDANNLLNGLNPEQLAAVTWPASPALILAGAGSGKTRVLTTRIAWLLQTSQASANHILAVTFTNKAAKEMQMRLSALVPFSTRSMWLGTFHGLCHRFLRLHFHEAQLPQSFQILDSSDQLSLIKRLLKEWNISDAVVAPRTLQGFINAQKESGLRSDRLSANNPYDRRLIECYQGYERQCQRDGVVDFAELMLRCYEVLQNHPLLCEHYQSRFSHILVDEFQDTNKLQYAWLKLLAGEHTAVFAVGDDDQSIYAFRGANVGNMTDFMREFNVEKPIKLEQNYRSVGHILQAANAVIENNDERLGKNLHTEAGDGDKLRFLWADSDLAEARFIVDEVKSLHNEDGFQFDDMAVLYRSNAQSRVIEQALFQAGVPYKIYGGLRFYERQEIKHALAYLRLCVNTEDDNSLLRVINVPARGIGARSIEKLQEDASLQGISLWQAACVSTNAKIKAFVALMDGMQQQTKELSLPDLIGMIVHQSGLYDFYQNQKGEHQDRLDNLDELVSAGMAFNPQESNFEILPENWQEDPMWPILAFLSNATLESGEKQAGEGESALQLMTVHASKGLEFNAVFLTGIEEGLFPSEMSLQEQGGLQEERRLMYVAITRARQRLYLSAAQQRLLHGKTQFGVVSRFFDEIPTEVIHSLSNRQTHHQANKAATFSVADKHAIQKIAKAQDYAGFHIGQNVRHAKFGTGVIVDALSKGDSAKLTINFGREGMKELDTKFAKLEVV